MLRNISLLNVTTIGKPSPLFDETAVDWATTINMGHDYVPKVSNERAARVAKRRRLDVSRQCLLYIYMKQLLCRLK